MGSTRITIPFKEVGVDVVSLAGRTRLGRVQRSEVGANLPNTRVQELGSDKDVGRIFDLPEVTVTVNAMDVGPCTPFLLAGIDASAVASGSVIEVQDMRYVCLVETFKSDGKTNKDIARSLYVPGAKLERFNYNYTANGDATEEYSFNATNRLWLKYDVMVASGVTSAGALSFSPNARVLKNGKYVLSVFASGIGYLAPEAVTGSTASSVTFDTTIVPNSTPVVITYHTDLSNQWQYTYEYAGVAPDAQPVGMRGFGVEVYLIKSGVSNQRVYRAQTCSVQGQFPNTRVQELGTEEVVGYMEGIPEVTGTIEINTFDFKLQELFTGDASAADDNYEPNELGTGDYGLLIKLFRRGVDRTTVGPEKTMWIPALDITQTSDQANVGQDQRQTFQFASRTGQLYIAKGAYAPFA